MGNAQEKPPESGGGGGLTGRAVQRAAGGGGGGGMGKPQDRGPPERGPVHGGESSPTADSRHLDAPAGALPPHLARLKNEGNHLFRHGQFGDAMERYSRAIEGFPGAGASLSFLCRDRSEIKYLHLRERSIFGSKSPAGQLLVKEMINFILSQFVQNTDLYWASTDSESRLVYRHPSVHPSIPPSIPFLSPQHPRAALS